MIVENYKNLQNDLKKRNFYTAKDSSAMFLYALLFPFLVLFVFAYVCMRFYVSDNPQLEKAENLMTLMQSDLLWFAVVYLLLTQLMFFAVFFVYNKLNRVSWSACRLNIKKAKASTCGISLFVGVCCVLGCLLLVEVCFGKLFSGLDHSSALDLPISNPYIKFVVNIFLVALLPAICEELIFRGVIFQGLKEKFSPVWGVLISAVLFALMHQNVEQLFYPLILGAVLATVFEKTGNLLYPMLIHFANNVTSLTLGLLVEVGVLTLPTFSVGVLFIALGVFAALCGLLFVLYKFHFAKQEPIQLEKEGNLVQKQPILVGKMPVGLIVGMVLCVVLMVINAVG